MSLISILTSAATKLPKTVLISLGFGIISFGAVTTAFNTLLQSLITEYNGLGSNLIAYLEISGCTTGLEILLGAYVARITIHQVSKLGLLNGLT